MRREVVILLDVPGNNIAGRQGTPPWFGAPRCCIPGGKAHSDVRHAE